MIIGKAKKLVLIFFSTFGIIKKSFFFVKNLQCEIKLLFLILLKDLNFFSWTSPNEAPISDGSKLKPNSEKTNFLS